MDRLEELNQEAEALELKLKKVKKVAAKNPLKNENFKEIIEEYDIPPYGLTFATFMGLTALPATQAADTIEEKYENRTASVIAASIIGVLSLPFALLTTPFIAAIESVVAIPRLLAAAIESGIKKSHNNNIERAKTSLKTLEKKLEIVNNEITELTNNEECVN